MAARSSVRRPDYPACSSPAVAASAACRSRRASARCWPSGSSAVGRRSTSGRWRRSGSTPSTAPRSGCASAAATSTPATTTWSTEGGAGAAGTVGRRPPRPAAPAPVGRPSARSAVARAVAPRADPRHNGEVDAAGPYRAMVLRATGRPLVEERLPPAPPATGEVLLRVDACAVCRTDLHVVDGELPDPKLPLVPGHQVVGRVVALGPGVAELAPGDRVGVPWLGWTCGACRYCRSDRENLCQRARFT